jgi:hypothetical protein
VKGLLFDITMLAAAVAGATFDAMTGRWWQFDVCLASSVVIGWCILANHRRIMRVLDDRSEQLDMAIDLMGHASVMVHMVRVEATEERHPAEPSRN